MAALVHNFSSADYSLETLSHNYSAKNWREVVENGRTYIVTPMTMIVPGVLNGSRGKLHYPPEEVGKDPTGWNGVPITYYHPVRNGKNVSAREDGILQAQGIGQVRNARTGSKLRADAWIDVAKANRLDPDIVKNVKLGKPMEISTGLFTDNVPAPAGAHFNGKRYTHIARNYRPDHLAILPDQKGACSLNDGCGLGVNSEERIMLRPKLWLTYNNRWPQARRDKLDSKSFAGPDESFPIESQKDVDSAAKLIGHAKDPEAVKSRIRSIAKRKGLKLPTSWQESTANEFSDGSDSNSDGIADLRFSQVANDFSSEARQAALEARREQSSALHARVQERIRSATARKASSAAEGASRMADRLEGSTKFDKHEEAHAKAAELHAKAAKRLQGTELGKRHEASAAAHRESASRVGASGKAYSATDKADAMEGSADTKAHSQLHAKAAEAHSAAAKAYGKSEAGQRHAELAETHRGIAKQLSTNQCSFHLTENVDGMSHEELRDKIHTTLRGKFKQDEPYPSIREVHDDHIKFDHGGQMKKCNYKMDGDEVKLGKIKNLKAVTTYVDDPSEPGMNRPDAIPMTMGSYNESVENVDGVGEHKAAMEASQSAHQASRSYMLREGDANEKKEHHERAASLHEVASALHKKAGNKGAVKIHDELAKEHRAMCDNTYNQRRTGSQPSSNSKRKGGKMAKLTANQRSTIVDNLVSEKGCGCFNEEDRDYLESLSDERLSTMNEQHEEHLSTNAAELEGEEDEEGDEGGEKEYKGKKGGKKKVANAEQPAAKRMTVEEFRATAPPEILEAVDNAARVTNAAKGEVITKLTAHITDKKTKERLTANLQKLTLNQLEDQLLLIPEPAKPEAKKPQRPVFGPTGNQVGVTEDETVENADDVPINQPIDYVALSTQHFGNDRIKQVARN